MNPFGEEVLAFARELAVGAGQVLMGYHEALDPARIGRKSTHRDLVTEADVASERFVLEGIRARFPDHAVYAEESGGEAHASGPQWIVDPLDGTVNFVHALPAFAVSIALAVDGVPQLGVVHLPALRETFWALRGGGCFRDGNRVHVSSTATLAEALLATGFPYDRSDPLRDNVRQVAHLVPRIRDLRRWGAASADLAFVACGRFDGFWELQLQPYDVAAGGLLVLEAGGIVTDARGGDGWLHAGNIAAGPAALHAELLRELAIADDAPPLR